MPERGCGTIAKGRGLNKKVEKEDEDGEYRVAISSRQQSNWKKKKRG